MRFESRFGRFVVAVLVGSATLTAGSQRVGAQVQPSLPDLNGDGVADYFMRLPVWSTVDDVVGQFRVFSGNDNTLIKGFASLQVNDGFGISTGSAGDLNADGIDDLLVGAPLGVSDGVPNGKVYIVSGLDGTILDVITASPWSYAGMTVAGLGDIDGGGLRDIAYSMRGATDAVEDTGLVVVHSTDIGEAILSLGGTLGDTSFGYAVAYLGDTNADGSVEIAVSAPMDGGGANTRGSVYVFECRDAGGGLRASQWVADARLVISNTALPSGVFGGALFLGPDIDGDGERELIVGSTIFLDTTEIAVIEAYDLSTGQIVASLSIDAQKLNSDINGDLVVDHRDVAEALDRMDQPADPLDPKSGDLDGDGLVDAGDVVSVIANLDLASITPATFSNGQRGEVTELVASLLFPRIHPCFGIGVGPGGGVGGIVIPPEGPGGGATIPDTPLNPDTVACCLYRFMWLPFDPDDRPPPPPGCDDDEGGSNPGGDDPPRPGPPGWSGEPGGGGDDPPDCDGMSILGPTFIEVNRSASFTVSGNPPGVLRWDVHPYPTPLTLRPLVVPSRPIYSVQGYQVGQGMVIVRVYENADVVCGESFSVEVVDCEQMTLDGPEAVSVGGEAIYTAQNLGAGMTVEWTVSGKLSVLSTTPTSVTVRGSSAGSGHVSARALYQNEPLTCAISLDVAVGCDFSVSGPVTLSDEQTATYAAQEQYSAQTVVWSVSGPLMIDGPSTGWSVQVRGDGCGNGLLTARLHDAEGVFLGCVVNAPITVQGPGVEPLALTGLPPSGYIQLSPSLDEHVVTLTATGVGTFDWIVESSVEDAVQVSASGAACTITILEATHVSVRVARDFCDESVEVQAGFSAIRIDLAIDSDNDDGWDEPSGSLQEDMLEDDPSGMKLMVVNRDDRDADTIPDYADGYGAFGPGSSGGVPGVQFVPLVVELRGLPAGSEVSFDYSASPPQSVVRSVVTVGDIEDAFYHYSRASGALRIWTHDGFEPRTIDDFVPSGAPYTIEDFGETRTLYVEAVRGSAVPVEITLRVTSQDLPVLEDTVRVLPFDSMTGLAVESIAGVGIHYGSAIGGPGVDIVIGTAVDDVISTGGGNDIIVGRAGDDEIDPGEGEDVIFASYGNDLIGPFNFTAGVNEGEDTYLSESDGQITTEQVLRVYRLIYGEDDPWLEIFLDPEWVGGHVECVAGDGVPFSNNDWDRRRDHIHGGFTYVIQLEFSIGNPFLAATRLRENLLHMASSVWGPAHLFQGGMIGTAFDRAILQDDYEEVITNYLDLRQAAFDNAAEASALLAGIYVQSIGIVSEGTDVVVSVSELTDGNLQAAVGLFPLLPARLLDDAAEGVLRIVRPGGETLDEFVKRGRVTYGSESGVGFIMRRNMPIEAKMVDDRLALLIGTAQNTNGPNGPLHDDLVRLLARQRIDAGDIEYATMNRSMRTATGLDTLGGIQNRRPDIVAIRRDGRVDLIEVRSDSQSRASVIMLLQEIWLGLPPNLRGSRFGVELNGDYFHEVVQ